MVDNKSYKDTFHFRGNSGFTRDKLLSLNVDPEINTTIKKNDDKSNVEIEGDEIVLKPDLSGLFKAKGKSHAKGGMDVYLEPDSFIFSADKSTAITKKKLELMELKDGGKAKLTPAEVVKKNVDPKHYNTLINNISDINKDELAKKSSVRMLNKYMEYLGNIAYLQEEKKGFPQGLPDISMGTAPVYKADVKEDIMEQKQYAKMGGTILPRAQVGAIVPPFDKNAKFVLQDGTITTLAQELANPDGLINEELFKDAVAKGQIKPYQGKYSGVKPKSPYSGVPLKRNIPGRMTTTVTAPPQETYFPPDGSTPKPGDVTGKPTGLNANWEFTPWQRLSHLYNGAKWASVKRYMPYRSHLNPSYADPNLVNPEQVVNDMKSGYNQQVDAAGSLSPILRNAQANSAYGEFLDKAPAVRSQYDNQNAQIQNQFAQYNNQIANNARAVNMQNDQKYYTESVVGQQNFDNMRDFLGDQWANNIFRDAEANTSLSYNLMTQNNPAWGFDFRSGNFVRNPKDIRDVTTDSKSDLYTELAGSLMEKVRNGQTLTKPEVDFFKGLSLGKLNFSPSIQKKGGMFRPKNNMKN